MKGAAKVRRPSRFAKVSRASALLLTGGLGVAAVPAPAKAQDGDREQVRNCITLTDVDRTRVVDDDTILFYLKNGTVYQNDLPNRCPTLEQEERFMYRVALNQLCNVDVITVLSDLGFGFMPMASCGLGKFAPISEEAAAELIRSADTQPERRR